MPELLKWQQRFVADTQAMSNEELLDETLSAAQGDGWDGCFTARGSWEFDCLKAELRKRLAGWLEEGKQ
jgi:hypothetical protein